MRESRGLSVIQRPQIGALCRKIEPDETIQSFLLKLGSPH